MCDPVETASYYDRNKDDGLQPTSSHLAGCFIQLIILASLIYCLCRLALRGIP